MKKHEWYSLKQGHWSNRYNEIDKITEVMEVESGVIYNVTIIAHQGITTSMVFVPKDSLKKIFKNKSIA